MNLLKKSEQILKSLQIKNGGILATPKNGAYPYVYTRDAVIITKALNRLGLIEESKRFYYFLEKYSKVEDYGEIFQRYNSNGLPSVTRSNQNDNEGLLLHGIYDTYLHDKEETFIQNLWNLINKTAELILSYSKFGLVKTKRSIHENQDLEEGYEIWANCAGYRGLKDASKMAEILNQKKKAKKWNKKAERIKKKMDKKMFNKKLGVYIKNTRFKNSPDISQLAPFYFNVTEDKRILKNTLKFLEKHIWDQEAGGFRRFRKFEVIKDWHWYTGGSGSWCSLTLMAARFYKKIGDKKSESKCIKWIENVSKKSRGLLPEHIATKDEYDDWKNHEIEFNNRIINEMKKAEKSIKKLNNRKTVYWANPLGWSHAEYVLYKKE